MAENIVDGGLFKFVFRHGTPEEWDQSVSVLAEGEIGLAIDPSDPTSTPRKHSAMGRFKHEGANIRVDADGTVVAYMGDDERFDYVYRFVSRDRMPASNMCNFA